MLSRRVAVYQRARDFLSAMAFNHLLFSIFFLFLRWPCSSSRPFSCLRDYVIFLRPSPACNFFPPARLCAPTQRPSIWSLVVGGGSPLFFSRRLPPRWSDKAASRDLAFLVIQLARAESHEAFPATDLSSFLLVFLKDGPPLILLGATLLSSLFCYPSITDLLGATTLDPPFRTSIPPQAAACAGFPVASLILDFDFWQRGAQLVSALQNSDRPGFAEFFRDLLGTRPDRSPARDYCNRFATYPLSFSARHEYAAVFPAAPPPWGSSDALSPLAPETALPQADFPSPPIVVARFSANSFLLHYGEFSSSDLPPPL